MFFCFSMCQDINSKCTYKYRPSLKDRNGKAENKKKHGKSAGKLIFSLKLFKNISDDQNQ